MFEIEPLELLLHPFFGGVLLVEDDDGDAFLVEEMLSGTAHAPTITRARTLAEAREQLAVSSFDCVLLDIGLPDGHGLEVLAAVLAADQRSAVVCLTGLDDERSGVVAVAAGAQDYLVKGRVDGDLLRRAIRYAVQRRHSQEQGRQLEASLLRAKENARLKRGLLPLSQTRDVALGVTTRYLPREGNLIGGDFFDVVESTDGLVFVLLGDVAGHGPDEAALGVSLRIAWRALVLAGVAPQRLFPVLEDVLIRERRSEEIFVQACMLVIGADRLHATLFLAGHLPPIRLDPAPEQLPSDPATAPLGLLAPGVWPGRRIALTAQWRLVLYTDGLVEGTRAPGGSHVLGVPGLLDLARSSREHADVADAVDDLLARVTRASGGALADDVAVVALQWPAARPGR